MRTHTVEEVRIAMRALAKLAAVDLSFAETLFAVIADGSANVLTIQDGQFVFAQESDIPKGEA